MAKLKLIPEPTFTAPVPVPVPGAGTVEVKFLFKHRTRDEMQRFLADTASDAAAQMDDVQLVMACASGWELADSFDEKNVGEFVRQYIAGPAAVYETYTAEMIGARQKNSVRPRL